MSPEAQLIAIAEACGYAPEDIARGYTCVGVDDKGPWGCASLPDYLDSLDAMHEAEKVLTDEQREMYLDFVTSADTPHWGGAFATAAQRAEAFLRTLNLWTTP